MSDIRAVILDIDGTLVLSNDQHARAYIEASKQVGLEGEYDEVRRLIGKGGDKLIPEAFGVEKESEKGAALDERKGEIFRDRYLPSIGPTAGARALCEYLRDRGVKLVVATSADEEDLKGLLERAEVQDLIQESTSAGDVDASKPDPDVVEAALESAGAAASEVVMIGDTPYDVEAATRAGVQIIAVRSGGWSDEDLEGAIEIYDDPADLLANVGRSILG